MADGDVMRIQTGPKGYGNAVYLRHDDGSITMAAHLNRFEPSLQAYTDSLRLSWQQASIDLYPLDRTFRYKAGERIGFSGSTGTGPPHLHVELRNAQNEPVNPLLSSLRGDVKDTRAPEFAALAIEHLDRSTYHLHRHEVLKQKQVTAGIDDFGTVEISGPVGLAALMHDRADGTNSRYAVYEWMMVVRGDTLFHARADRFPFSMDQKMFLDRSFPLLAETGDGFQRFYVVNRNQLPFYKTVKNRGVLHFLPGEYEVRLIAQDLFGNRKESVVRFQMAEAGEDDAREDNARQDNARQDRLQIDDALEGGARENDVREEISSTENEAIFADPAQPVHSANPINPIHAPAGGILRVVESVPAYPLPSRQQNPHIHNGNSAPIPFARYPAQKGVESVALSHQPEQKKTIPGNIHTLLFLESQEDFLLEHHSPSHKSSEIDESKPQEGTFVQVRAHLAPGQPTMLHTPDQRIQLLIPRDALYDSLEVVMSVAWRDGLPEIAFDPGGLPVYEHLRLRVQLPDSVAQGSRVGVFGRHPRTGKLIFLGAERAGHWIESPMMELANVILVRDDEPPVPGMPDLRRNLAGKMVVVVPIRDEGSGIAPEASHVFVDGVRGITDYDPDKKELIYSHPEFVPRKGVDVRVESQDGVGNRSVIRFAGGRW